MSTVYNHDMAGVASTYNLSLLQGVNKNAGRALGCSNVDDVVLLPSSLKKEYEYVIQHYADIGLEHSSNIWWGTDYEALSTIHHNDYDVSVFFFSEIVHCYISDHARFKATQSMNSKNSFITLCKEYEIPIPETYCYYAGEIPIDLQLSYPLYLKYDVSAAGIGVSKCCSPSELNESIYLMSSKIAYQLQEEIAGDKVTVLNVQYFACNNGHAHRVAVTEQVTNNNIHMFNKYPSVYNPFSLFDELANVIAQKGVRDMFTFDVVAVEKGGRVKYIAIECNPRWGTASYPVRIAQKLNIQQWNAVDLETNKKDLSKINLGHLIYSKGSGVVFVNWGCISDRKVGVLIAGDSYDHNEILQELKRRVL